MIRLISLFTVLLALALSADAKVVSYQNTSECSAALRKPRYSKDFPVPSKLRKYIEEYREGWKSLCNRANKGLVSIHDLLSQGKIIQRSFGFIFPRVHRKAAEVKKKKGGNRGFYKKAHKALAKDYPKFIPGFEGSIMDYEYFRVRTESFKRHLQYATEEDQRFFRSYAKLRKGGFFPWIKRLDSNGGCLKFGEYRWVSTLEKLQSLKKEMNGKVYRQLLSSMEYEILDSVASTISGDGVTYPICSCDAQRKVVLRDYQKLRKYLKTRDEFEFYEKKIGKIVKRLRAKKIAVRSASINRCQGSDTALMEFLYSRRSHSLSTI